MSEKMMILMCIRVGEEFGIKITTASTRGICNRCGAEVHLAPSSAKVFMENTNVEVLCTVCTLADPELIRQVAIAEKVIITNDQMKELREEGITGTKEEILEPAQRVFKGIQGVN